MTFGNSSIPTTLAYDSGIITRFFNIEAIHVVCGLMTNICGGVPREVQNQGPPNIIWKIYEMPYITSNLGIYFNSVLEN